jgi:hypothetical protein
MRPTKPIHPFPPQHEERDPFDVWNPLGLFDHSDLDGDDLIDPFLTSPSSFNSPLKLVSPGLANPATSHVAQLPVRESTWTRRTVPPSPIVGATSGTTDAEFDAACSDPALVFNPAGLGFTPATIWANEEITFGQSVAEFFQKKNCATCRFPHKLFNALRLSGFRCEFPRLTGVMWLNDKILRVDKLTFARLIGIKSIDGSLFYQQGNFPSHGFFEIGAGDQERFVPPDVDLTDVDFENVRILVHPGGQFTRGCSSEAIQECIWANRRLRAWK